MEELFAHFETLPADVDESVLPGESAEAMVERLAISKGRIIQGKRPEAMVLSSDTVVMLGQNILGKPAHRQEAQEMLQELAGREFRVLTGSALHACGRSTCLSTISEHHLLMRHWPPEDLQSYLDDDHWRGRAGAFAMHGGDDCPVQLIAGDMHAVRGLDVSWFRNQLENLS